MRARRLTGARTTLEPLSPDHHAELLALRADPALYRYTGGTPPDAPTLQERITRQTRGRSPDQTEYWLNWVVRAAADSLAVGTVQATIPATTPPGSAGLAWVIGTAHQGRGYATDAAQTMARWLRVAGVTTLYADIHPENAASIAVARSLGLRSTDAWKAGERRWERTYGASFSAAES